MYFSKSITNSKIGLCKVQFDQYENLTDLDSSFSAIFSVKNFKSIVVNRFECIQLDRMFTSEEDTDNQPLSSVTTLNFSTTISISEEDNTRDTLYNFNMNYEEEVNVLRDYSKAKATIRFKYISDMPYFINLY